MKQIEINTVDDFFNEIKKYQKNSWWKFRGQADIRWKLLPKAGRETFRKYNDQDMFKAWKRRAINLIEKKFDSDWDYIATAQHTGLPTRLLDWSHNPLIAAFFASNEYFEEDGVVYAYHCEKRTINTSTFSPFEIDVIGLVMPDTSNLRIGNQYGYFTIHPKPNVELTVQNCEGKLEKIIIKKTVKKELLFKLNHFGINYLHIYPDLEGLSKHLCWFSENYDYWTDHSIDEIEIKTTKPG